MDFIETGLTGSYVIQPKSHSDNRGDFTRAFCAEEFSVLNLNTAWVQANLVTNSRRGVLRGLHMQRFPHSEEKLVRCVRGRVWDVIVDLRLDSPTLGKWFGTELSSSEKNAIYVPQGFAHGYVSLSRKSEVFYLVSAAYTPKSEVGIIWNDNDLEIAWPLKPALVSQKDARNITYQEFLTGRTKVSK